MKSSSVVTSVGRVAITMACILSLTFIANVSTTQAQGGINCYTKIPVSQMKPEQKAKFLAKYGMDCFQHCMEKPCLQGADAQGLQGIGQEMMKQVMDMIKQAMQGGGGGGSGGGSGSGSEYQPTDLGYTQDAALTDLYSSFGTTTTGSNIYDYFGTDTTGSTGGTSGTEGTGDTTADENKPGLDAQSYFCPNGDCTSTTASGNTSSESSGSGSSKSSSNSSSGSNSSQTSSQQNSGSTYQPYVSDGLSFFANWDSLSWSGQTAETDDTPATITTEDGTVTFLANDGSPDRIIYGNTDPLSDGTITTGSNRNTSSGSGSSVSGSGSGTGILGFLEPASNEQEFAWKTTETPQRGVLGTITQSLGSALVPSGLSLSMLSPVHGLSEGLTRAIKAAMGQS